MKKGSSSSARTELAKNHHGMKLRSDKNGSGEDLCEIIRQLNKKNASLEAQVKRLKAVIAAKDSELEKVLPLVALHREAENTGLKFVKSKILKIQEIKSIDSPIRFVTNGTDMPTADTSRRDLYGPEVEHSLGMVRNCTPSLVAADISSEAVAEEVEILSQTAAGDSAIEDAADNSFEIYEDPDTENVIEKQGLPVGPSSSGRMPLGERECEGTISWNPDMDQDADMADQSIEVYEDNPEDAVGKQAATTNSLPSSPTTEPTVLGQNYVGAKFGSTAGTRTAFGSGLLNISPFAALSAAGYNPTTVTASPEPMRTEINGENENTLQPRHGSNLVMVLTGKENEKRMHRTGGTLYKMENGQRREQSIDFNGEIDNTLQPQQEPISVTVLTGEENEQTMHHTSGTLYAMENDQRREQGIDFLKPNVPVTNEEGEGYRSGRRPTLGYNPTTLTQSPEPMRSERKRKMSEMFPYATGKRFKIFEDP